MLSNAQKTFLFATIMCVVCSITLTLAAVGLKPQQDRNIRIDKQKNILKAFGLIKPNQKSSSTEIEELYTNSIQSYFLAESGELVTTKTDNPVFVVGTSDKIEKYAIPFKAYGLWSWVYGYVALAGDGDTIVGLTVYSHGETPGLGGECDKPWFQNQFIGKKITDQAGDFVSIGIAKGKAKDSVSEIKLAHTVDGISGATVTSKGLEKYLKIELQRIEALSVKLRKG